MTDYTQVFNNFFASFGYLFYTSLKAVMIGVFMILLIKFVFLWAECYK